MSESLPFSTVAVFTGSFAAAVAWFAPDRGVTPPVAPAATGPPAPARTHCSRIIAPLHPRRRREVAALPHRGVENAHTTLRCGRWDSTRIDERLVISGGREARHS